MRPSLYLRKPPSQARLEGALLFWPAVAMTTSQRRIFEPREQYDQTLF